MAEAEVTDVTSEKRWWGPFFDAFAETGVVSSACRKARISRLHVYRTKKQNPEFARRWAEAEEMALGTLEDVATTRSIKNSDTLLIFLLKTRGRAKYGDQPQNINLNGTLAVGTMSLDECDNDELRRRLADAAASLLPEGPDALREA